MIFVQHRQCDSVSVKSDRPLLFARIGLCASPPLNLHHPSPWPNYSLHTVCKQKLLLGPPSIQPPPHPSRNRSISARASISSIRPPPSRAKPSRPCKTGSKAPSPKS